MLETCLFGAGQCLESFAAFDMKMPEGKKPALIALYETISPAGIRINHEVEAAIFLYPDISVQIGLELPTHNTEALQELGCGGDEIIKKLACRYRDLNTKIYLRIGYEFDGPWNGYEPSAYIAAFRRIVNVFRSMDIRNVEYVWNTYICDNMDMYQWYPGDDYVDWFSFNTVTAKFSADWFMGEAARHNKPVMIGEASYAIVENKMTFEEWCGEFFQMLDIYPIKAFQYINWEWGVYPRHMNWYDWVDGRASDYPERMADIRQKTKENSFAFRSQQNDKALIGIIDCARGLKEQESKASWQPAHDHASFAGSGSYSVTGACCEYGDGWKPHWSGQILDVTINPDRKMAEGILLLYLLGGEGEPPISIIQEGECHQIQGGGAGFSRLPVKGRNNVFQFRLQACKGYFVKLFYIILISKV